MTIETVKTLICDRCGAREGLDREGDYSWMLKPKRCERGSHPVIRWVATPEGHDNHATLCVGCGESLMEWWETPQ